MPRIRIYLDDADRERFGYAEPLEFDYQMLMQLEAEVLQQEVPDFDPDAWFDFLRDYTNVRWRHVLVWLALRRNGIRLPYGEVDFNRQAFNWSTDTPAEPEGKDASSTPETTSSTNDDATSPSSPISSDSSP